MSKTLLVEGELATVDTLTALTTQGSVSAPSRVVPSGYTKIQDIIVVGASDNGADGSGVIIVELSGSAILHGAQRFVVGSHGSTAGQAGSDEQANHGTFLHIKDADIQVRPGDVININAVMAGTDIGSATYLVTLIWGK